MKCAAGHYAFPHLIMVVGFVVICKGKVSEFRHLREDKWNRQKSDTQGFMFLLIVPMREKQEESA
jgi:hypothetical protein